MDRLGGEGVERFDRIDGIEGTVSDRLTLKRAVEICRKEHKERREGKNRSECLIFIFLCVLCVLCGYSISTFLVRGCRADHRFITCSIEAI